MAWLCSMTKTVFLLEVVFAIQAVVLLSSVEQGVSRVGTRPVSSHWNLGAGPICATDADSELAEDPTIPICWSPFSSAA